MKQTEPIPPATTRADALGRLKRELWIANDTGETELAHQLQRRIEELSAGSSSESPRRETTARHSPAMKTASRSPRVPRI